MKDETKGKYALTSPTPGGYFWWAINDMEKMYAVATVQASFPNAEEVIRFAWSQIPDPKK